MITIIKCLNQADLDFNFSGTNFQITYTNHQTDELEIVNGVMDSNSFEFEYLDTIQIDGYITFNLLSPQGNVIAIKDIAPSKIIGKASAQLEFSIFKVNLNAGNIKPAISIINGKLLDSRAAIKTEDVQIIIQTSSSESPEEFENLVSVRTESGGYFTFIEPEKSFEQAKAIIAINSTIQEIPITLTSSEQGNQFPKQLILVFESTIPETDLSAQTDTCPMNFHQQGRVLEEFSYYALVRTSDPEIRSYEIKEDEQISVEDILGTTPGLSSTILDAIVATPIKFFGKKLATPTTARILDTSAIGTATTSVPTSLNNQQLNRLLKDTKVSKSVVRTFLDTHGVLNADNFHSLLQANEIHNLGNVVASGNTSPKGRLELDAENTIDWDDKPTIYEATSIAYGHLLQYKQQWVADGYSLGDLIYSLPLAPGQKKQIVTYDWEHRLSASDEQSISARDSISSMLSHDRDINEIAAGTVNEKMHGSSSSTVKSASAGLGLAIGPMVLGASGGISKGSSSASQDSMRAIAASNAQHLSDKTIQSASSIRSQRSTVIQTVTQGETSSVTTESVANYNHCHALTMQYFEVLRHFKIQQKLADVRECLFIPLPISNFDLEKTQRWSEILSDIIIDRNLRKSFSSLLRVKDQWKHSNFPATTFAAENVLNVNGVLNIRFDITCPSDKLVEDSRRIFMPNGLYYDEKFTKPDYDEANWTWMRDLNLGDPLDFYNRVLRDKPNKDLLFRRAIGSKIVKLLSDAMQFSIINQQGSNSNINIDISSTGSFNNGVPMVFSIHAANTSHSRENFEYLQIILNDTSGNLNDLFNFTRVNVVSGSCKYRTQHKTGFLFNGTIHDDLNIGDHVVIFCGPNDDELRNPKDEDVMNINELIDHLNANLEYYHTAIWKYMSAERRFMLLDGIKLFIPQEGKSRSVASLVENKLIGIVGNSMVLPVIPGLNLNPDFKTEMQIGDSLEVVPLKQFYDHEPLDPIRISVPTRGVFGEAMLGQCNSCEIKDENRFWRWEESPIPDSPTSISPPTIATPTAIQPNLSSPQFSQPLVNIQSAPEVSTASTLGGILELLGKSDTFNNITGLSQNQTNAIEGLKAAFSSSESFASKALEKAKFDKVADLYDRGKIKYDQFKQASESAGMNPKLSQLITLNDMVSNKVISQEEADKLKGPITMTLQEKIKIINDQVTAGSITKEQGSKAITDLMMNDLIGQKPATPKQEEPSKPTTPATDNPGSTGSTGNSTVGGNDK